MTRAQWIVDRLLQESPRDIPAISFGMEDPVAMARLVSKLDQHKNRHIIGTFDGIDLIKSGRFIYAKDEYGLTYFVQFQDEKYSALPGRHVTQIAVWSLGGHPGLSTYVFWNHLFPIHGTIMTDAQQTQRGRNFWIGVVKQAFKKNLFIYRVDLIGRGIDQLHSYEDFVKWSSTLYGEHKRHENERIVVTDAPLS